MDRRGVVVDGMRTAFGRNGGSLRGLYTTDLCAEAIKGLLKKTQLLEKTKVDAVYLGSAFHDVHCNNIAR